MLITNFRPISLANTALKLFTHLLAERLVIWGAQHNLISPFQAAYKKGAGCEDHVFALKSSIEYSLGTGHKKVFACFVDLSSAFDMVGHTALFDKMRKKGISTKFINIVRCIYSGAQAKIRTSKGMTEYFNIERSVLQGETLSPILFTLFLDDLVEVLQKSGIPPIVVGRARIHALLYADDVSLLSTNCIHLQEMMDVVAAYFDRNKMKVNLGKTKVVIFGNYRKLNFTPSLTWRKDNVEIVDKYMYLGVPFSSKVNKLTQDMAGYFSLKAKVAEDALFKLFYRSKMRTFGCRIRLFNSMVRSVLLYCSPLWGITEIENLERVQVDFLRKTLGLPKYCPHWLVRLETETPSLKAFFIKSTF